MPNRFLFIWSKGLELLGKPNSGEVDKTLDLWKLAGRIVLLDSFQIAEEGDAWYEDFAKGEAGWFKDFMENEKGSFMERFEAFSINRDMSFNYPRKRTDQGVAEEAGRLGQSTN